MKRAGSALVSLAVLAVSLPLVASLVACGDDEPPTGEQNQTTDSGPPPPPPTSTPAQGDAQTQSGPKVECAIGAALELEPNDTKETATPFSELAICGVLETAGDVDYLTFDTPAGTKLTVFQAVIEGKVDFDLTLNGKTFGPADVESFGSGTYLVKAFTKSKEPSTYKIRVQFDPL